MLVDAVQSSPFLTDELTDHLIGKLQSLASLGERELMHKRVDVPSRVKMQNSDALLNIDLIQQAMREKRKIRFRYFHYDAAKQKALNHDGKTYELTPVRLIYSDELYYMIGFRDKWANAGSGHQPFTPYRVDRMRPKIRASPAMCSKITSRHHLACMRRTRPLWCWNSITVR